MLKPIVITLVLVLITLILIRISPYSYLLLDKSPIAFSILPVCSFVFVGWIFRKYDLLGGVLQPGKRTMFFISWFWVWAVLDLLLDTRQLLEQGPANTSFLTYLVLVLFVFIFIIFLAHEKGKPQVDNRKESLKKVEKPLKEVEKPLKEKTVSLSASGLLKGFFISLCFVVFVYLVLPSDSSVIQYQQQQIFFKHFVVNIVGWACILFFGFIGFYNIRKLFDKSPALIINSFGLTNNTNGFATGFIPWKEIKNIHEYSNYLMVEIENPEKYFENHNPLKRIISKSHYKLTGGHIPILHYSIELDHEELSKMLRHYFDAYGNH